MFLTLVLVAGLDPSASAALEHLRRVMDRYHDRFSVYEDVSSPGDHFFAWAKVPGDGAAVSMNGSSTSGPHSGATAIRAEFTDVAGANFGGFYLLNGVLPSGELVPLPNFGTISNAGVNLTGATEVAFWARGEVGGETIDFLVGGVGRDPGTGAPTAPFPDSTPVVKKRVVLTTQWTRYVMDLAGRDLSYVLGGFGWVASDADNPGGAIFFLDDVQYNLSPAALAARLDQPRFLRSFETLPFQAQPAPVGDFDFVQRNIAFTYDNALVLLAFLAEGSPDGLRRARLIGDAFVYAAEHDRTYDDGRLRDAYRGGDLVLPPGWTPNGRVGTVPIPGYYLEGSQTFVEIEQGGLSTGNDAWGMIALLALHRATGDVKYRTAALRIADVVRGFRQDAGTYQGFRGGLDQPESAMPTARPWASSEHNLDLFAAFLRLAEVTGDPQWTVEADHARQFVESMWDPSIGCYRAGTIDSSTRNETAGQLPVDVQAWSGLADPSVRTLHPGVLLCGEQKHALTDQGFAGFDFNDDRDGVWFEGSAQMAVAYERMGQPSPASNLRAMLAQAQATPPWGDGFGLAATSREGLTSGFGFSYFRRLHIGATAWNVFAQLSWNPFYGIAVRQGALHTVTPCRLLDTRQPGQGPALSSGVPRVVATVGSCGIPATARSLAVNLTVTGGTGLGFLTLHPSDQTAPVASTINFAAGQTRTNNAMASLAVTPAGNLTILPFVAGAGTVHAIVDVTGYFE